MERLAVMYLLKLRYGDEFGNSAGGLWRLIFVLALMPWLRRYRLADELFEVEKDITKADVEEALAEGEETELVTRLSKKDENGAPEHMEDPQQEARKLRAYVKALEKKIEEKLGSESAQHLFSQIAQQIVMG